MTIIQEEITSLSSQLTEPDIGPLFISQFHSNKFTGNKHAETGSVFQHDLKLSFANFVCYSAYVLRSTPPACSRARFFKILRIPRIIFPRLSQFSTNRTLSLWQYLLQHVYVDSIAKVRQFYLKMASASPDSVPVDDIKDLLTCSMCSEALNEPKSLSCLHNFCKACLGEYIN